MDLGVTTQPNKAHADNIHCINSKSVNRTHPKIRTIIADVLTVLHSLKRAVSKSCAKRECLLELNNMTTPEYLTNRKAQGRSQVAFCALTKSNNPEDTTELAQLESMLKRGDVTLVRDVEFNSKDASMSYRLYRIVE